MSQSRYLTAREAAKQLRSNRDSILRWFRELQHYGFIVMTNPGSLGVDGKGKAAHWRLTECPCNDEPPTKAARSCRSYIIGTKDPQEAAAESSDEYW